MDANYLEKIVAYYRDSEISYSQGWDLKHSLAIHAGYFDKGNTNFRKALKRLNEIAAEHAQIKESDYVLDAGCGVGGSSIFLARNYNCKVLGITLSETQINSATKNALKYGVDGKVKFQNKDYTRTGLEPNSFDVVWAIESVCHSVNKLDFIREAFRLLKPNGRLIVIDYCQGRNPKTEKEKEDYTYFLNSVACENLEKPLIFKDYLEFVGFKKIIANDSTINFLPNTKRLEVLGTLSVWMNSVLKILKIKRTDARSQGGKAALLTSQFAKNGMLKYYIFSAKKL